MAGADDDGTAGRRSALVEANTLATRQQAARRVGILRTSHVARHRKLGMIFVSFVVVQPRKNWAELSNSGKNMGGKNPRLWCRHQHTSPAAHQKYRLNIDPCMTPGPPRSLYGHRSGQRAMQRARCARRPPRVRVSPTPSKRDASKRADTPQRASASLRTAGMHRQPRCHVERWVRICTSLLSGCGSTVPHLYLIAYSHSLLRDDRPPLVLLPPPRRLTVVRCSASHARQHIEPNLKARCQLAKSTCKSTATTALTTAMTKP